MNPKMDDRTLLYAEMESDSEAGRTGGTSSTRRWIPRQFVWHFALILTTLGVAGIICVCLVLRQATADAGMQQGRNHSDAPGGHAQQAEEARGQSAGVHSNSPAAPASAVETAGDALVITQIVPGDGRTFPMEGDLLYVSYLGKLPNGTIFETSSHGRFDSFSFWFHKDGGLIRGWIEGLQQMSLGERALLHIPSKLAYGAKAHGKIPANSDLTFDMQLLAIGPRAYSMVNISSIMAQGDGVHRPRSGDTVYLNFVGFLEKSGKKFEASKEHTPHLPFRFTLGTEQVDRGMEFAVQLLTLGEHAKINIPAVLAFGAKGAGPIPPDADLVYDIDLLAIQKRDLACFDACGDPPPPGYESVPTDALTRKSP